MSHLDGGRYNYSNIVLIDDPMRNVKRGVKRDNIPMHIHLHKECH